MRREVMIPQAKERVIWFGKRFRRGDNTLLATTMLALLAIAPSWNASLAASGAVSSVPVSEAMLWWLHSSLSTTGSTEAPAIPVLATHVSTLRDSAPPLSAVLDGVSALRSPEETSLDELHDLIQTLRWPSSSDVAPLIARRYDATRRLMEYSLPAHEAATRSGIRTNRFLE